MRKIPKMSKHESKLEYQKQLWQKLDAQVKEREDAKRRLDQERQYDAKVVDENANLVQVGLRAKDSKGESDPTPGGRSKSAT